VPHKKGHRNGLPGDASPGVKKKTKNVALGIDGELGHHGPNEGESKLYEDSKEKRDATIRKMSTSCYGKKQRTSANDNCRGNGRGKNFNPMARSIAGIKKVQKREKKKTGGSTTGI